MKNVHQVRWGRCNRSYQSCLPIPNSSLCRSNIHHKLTRTLFSPSSFKAQTSLMRQGCLILHPTLVHHFSFVHPRRLCRRDMADDWARSRSAHHPPAGPAPRSKGSSSHARCDQRDWERFWVSCRASIFLANSPSVFCRLVVDFFTEAVQRGAE